MSKRNKPRLCIDIDNVVAQTDEVMRKVIADATEGRVNLEYENIREFAYDECRDNSGQGITKKEWKIVHERFSKPKNLWLVQPYQGVQENLESLGNEFVIHFATSRLPSARATTIAWLENHDFPPHDIHFLSHGEKHITLGNFFAAVEDHYEQAVDFAGATIPSYLMKRPWNETKPQVENLWWADDWTDLTERLLSGSER